MALHSIGDMAKLFVSRNQMRGMKAELSDLSSQLSTGRHGDLGKALETRRNEYMSLQTVITAKTAFQANALSGQRDLETSLAHVTRAAETMAELSSDLTAKLGANRLSEIGTSARSAFGQLVSVVNGSVGDTFIFGGYGQNPPLPEAEILLTSARAAVSSSTDYASVVSNLEQWFSDPSGFDALVDVGADRSVHTEFGAITIGTRATAPEVKQALLSTLKIVLGSEVASAFETDEVTSMIAGAKQQETALVSVAGRLGDKQEKLEIYVTSTNAQIAAFQTQVSDFESIDQFETATRFQALEAQIETSFAITARLSRLSLADYI